MDSQILKFNPTRLKVARQRRGLTQTKLAEYTGLTVRSISAHESGKQTPTQGTVDLYAEVLSFPPSFFCQDDLEQIEPDAVSFRAMSKMTAGVRDMALSSGSIALLLNQWIESKFELPGVAVPDLSSTSDPETAAIAVRQAWGLGDAPIPNMVHLLESKGVRIFSISIESERTDAFSMWKGDRPFVFLNTRKSPERSRFDAAHELGHLVLHHHAMIHSKEAELDANQFASAFLMPRDNVFARVPRFPSLADLVTLKKFWGVSVMALTVRMHKLKLLSDWQYRSLMAEIHSSGFHKEEPNRGPWEYSKVLDQILKMIRQRGMTKSDIARALHVYPEDLDELMFGLTLVSIEGSGRQSLHIDGVPRQRRQVKLAEPNSL